MELKDFIKETISAISNGIIESQKEFSETDLVIIPEKMFLGKDGNKLLNGSGNRIIQELDFEVNVSIDEKSNTEGGAKIKVFGFVQVGGQGGIESTSNIIHKLKFKIPIAFPTTQIPDRHKSAESSFGEQKPSKNSY
jgi:hypothetical protein